MNTTRIHAVVGALLWLLPAAGAIAQDDLERARGHFERARGEGISSQERSQWLERSMATYPTYRAAYELGKLRREAADAGVSEPALEPALESFHRAFDLTDQDKYLAQAAYQIGITHERMGHPVEARHWLRRSLGFASHETVRRVLRDLELRRRGQILSAAEILDELRIERTFGVAKAELRVSFELNRADLDQTGHRQAVELGHALREGQRQAPDDIFYLLGHTDRQCPRGRPDAIACDRHNLELSERRAASVRRVLTDQFGLASGRIRAVGCGRDHLLSERDSAEDHSLNRRVVVMITAPSADARERLCGVDSGLL